MRILHLETSRFSWLLVWLLSLGHIAWAQSPAIQGVSTHQSRCPNTGIISIAAAGNNLRYSVSGTETGTGTAVNLGPQDNNVFTTVNPGTYTVTVRDYVSGEVTTRSNVVVAGSYNPLLFSTAVTDIKCTGEQGTITASVNSTTGRANYTYSLLDQNNNVVRAAQASNTFTGLAYGDYRVQVTDSCTNVSRQNVRIGYKQYEPTLNGQWTPLGFTNCNIMALAFSFNNIDSTAWEPPFTITKESGGGSLQGGSVVVNRLTNAQIALNVNGADFFVNSPTANTPSITITDRCGHKFTQAVYSKATLITNAITNTNCQGVDIRVRLPYIRLYNNGRVTMTLLNFGGTVVQGPISPARLTITPNGEYTWDLTGVAPGNYTLRFANSNGNGCQTVDYPLQVGSPSLTEPSFSCGISCTAGRTDVLITPGTQAGNTPPAPPYTYTLTSGPAGQTYPITYTSNGGYYTMPGLLPGFYRYTVTTACGSSVSGSFSADCADYTFTHKSQSEVSCGNLSLSVAYTPAANVPYAYIVRSLQVLGDNGAYQTVPNPSITSLGQTSLGANTLRYNNLAPGTYRELLSYGQYNSPCRNDYSAPAALNPAIPSLDTSQAFNCNDNTTGQVTAVATGGSGPYDATTSYKYYLLDTENHDAVIATNNTGTFTGLIQAKRYAIRAEDACNSARLDVTLRPLSAPDFAISRLTCNASTLQLQARELYGATYSWTGPNGYKATGRTITIANPGPSTAGDYTVTVTLGNCSNNATSYTVTADACAPLPVTLVSFTAKRQTSSAVALGWVTASETNSQRFEIERSTDGQHFTNVSEVAAAGNSATVRVYAYTDAAAPLGALYYRLRQVDTDGTAHYSAVVAVGGGSSNNASLTVYPNPWVGNELHLTLGASLAGPLTCTLRNAAGQVVLRQPVSAPEAVLHTPNLAPGIYLLTVERNGERVVTQRLTHE